MEKLDFSLILLLLFYVFASKCAIKCNVTYVFVVHRGKCGIVGECTVKCVKYWLTTRLLMDAHYKRWFITKCLMDAQ